jgi:peptide/nickel transport system substrate-binding protein
VRNRHSDTRGRRGPVLGLILLLAVVGSACGSPRAGTDSAGPGSGTSASGSPRTLVMVDRHEPLTLFEKYLAAGTAGTARRLFNAYLAVNDEHGTPMPYLAEALPQLDTDTWRVFPDGRMETTYRLRPSLTWHDGHPLTADDFMFAYGVYADPAVGIFSATPQNLVEELLAPDARTVVIRWRTSYPDAGDLTGNTLEPLPRHLLEPAYLAMKQDPAARDTFLNLPYWTTQYVGAGPYRLEQWAPGLHIEASAFAGYTLGRPKIDRIIYRFITDENAILSNVLAGEIQYTASTSLRVTQAQVLKQEWGTANKGAVLYSRNSVFYNHVQFRPEFQRSPALVDVRVRQALAHAVDRQAVVDVLFEGDSSPAHTFISTGELYFPAVDRAITKYAYDPRRSEQLMNEAGLVKDREGLFVDARGSRFLPDFEALEGADYERAGQIISDSWRRAGIDVQYSVLPNAMIRDNERRHKAPGITSPGAGQGNARATFSQWSTSEIGAANNRWTGSNRGGWSDADFDRLFDAWNTTLEPVARDQVVAQGMKILSDQLPGIPIYYNIYPLAIAAPLRGPTAGPSSETVYWNIHDWQLG